MSEGTADMPDEIIEPREHYVYALYREDGVTPFYIGMGKKNRWLQHEGLSRRRKNHKDHIIAGMLERGFDSIPKAKLHENLTKTEAIAIEIDLIAEIGRLPDGPLVNFTSGGEGVLNLSPDVLAARSAKVSAANKREDVSAKKRAAMTGRKFGPRSDETKEKLRQANLGKKMPDHVREIALANLVRNYPFTPEQIERRRQSRIGHKQSAETIEKRVSKLRGRKWSEEERQERAKTRLPKSPETIEKIRIAAKEQWADPAHREKRAALLAERMAIKNQNTLDPSE